NFGLRRRVARAKPWTRGDMAAMLRAAPAARIEPGRPSANVSASRRSWNIAEVAVKFPIISRVARPAAACTSLPALLAALAALMLAGCGERRQAEESTGSSTAAQQSTSSAPAGSGSYGVYVTNEMSGDMTVIDGETHEVLATVALGKRPRGIRDRKS